MKIAVFSAQKYDKLFLNEVNKKYKYELTYFEERLHEYNANITKGYDAVCCFVNDDVSKEVVQTLKNNNVKLIAMRCTGVNNVDLKKAKELKIPVVNVPGYSPYAVAEHAIGLMLSLNRHIHRAYNRVKEGNFSIEGFVGFDMHGKTAGVIGMGKIGLVMAERLLGLGLKVLAYDPRKKNTKENNIQYTDLDNIYINSDIITLHCPLTKDNHHMINEKTLKLMKQGVMLINTARGALIDANCLTKNIKSGKIGYLGLDVYEEEENLFSKDLSENIIYDDVFARLITFPNVLITAHQAFFTKNALAIIASTTFKNIDDIANNKTCANELTNKI